MSVASPRGRGRVFDFIGEGPGPRMVVSQAASGSLYFSMIGLGTALAAFAGSP